MADVYQIACAAGFSGDRTDVARPLIDELLKHSGSKYLIFEALLKEPCTRANREISKLRIRL